MPTLDASELEGFARGMFEAVGVATGEASIVAASLVGANLRGHDSHGVMRIPFYVEGVEQGRVHPGAPLAVVRETPAMLLCDAGWGFGQVQLRRLLDLLIPKARELGVASAAVQKAGHTGRMGEYVELAAETNMVLLTIAGNHAGKPRMAPPGGTTAILGTSPFTVGVPTDGEPIVLDFATSVVAEGKARVKWLAGEPCPEGWLIDAEGRPTTDPAVMYQEPAGSLRPLGGERAYKGFGMALLIDMLAGGLSGGKSARADYGPPLGNDVLFILFDPAAFAGMEHFASQIAITANYVRNAPVVEGAAEIQLPGDPERRTMAERLENGIPVDQGNWDQLVALGDRLGVSAPGH